MKHTIPLRSGTLTLSVDYAELPLDELCGFGSRRSRKRGFLFISKVLGKHIPVRPSTMREVHRRLAKKLVDIPGPAVLIGMAETATALGQGVFEELLELTGREDVLFLHSTRYHLNRSLALTFDESHSHAADHLVYQPADPENVRLFASARTLVLIDDEISTGRTLDQLAQAYRKLNPNVQGVHLVCLTNWSPTEVQFAVLGVRVFKHSLLRGEFDFAPDETFDPGVIPNVIGKGDRKDTMLPSGGGRFGLRRRLTLDVGLLEATGIQPGERILVLGTGEFSYPPYRLALALEEAGHDVTFQSTTRSPILVGEDIRSALEFIDNYHDDIPNFLYNVADRQYDRILIGYETSPLPAAHRLPEILGARVIQMGQER